MIPLEDESIIINKLKNKHKFDRVIFIWDEINDVNSARIADLSIGFNPEPIIENEVDHVIREENLKLVLEHIKRCNNV